jgi:hypothetical protein
MSRKYVFGAAGVGYFLAFLACSSITPNPAYTVVFVPDGGDDGGSDGAAAGDDSGDDSGDDGDDGGAIYGNCPNSCSQAGTNCCLVDVDAAAGLLGTCQTPTACSAANGSFIACGNTPDLVDCPDGSTTCCLSFSDSGSPSAYCAASCPTGTPYACNGDQTTCPPEGNWNCEQIPGSTVPVAALGECVASDAGGD